MGKRRKIGGGCRTGIARGVIGKFPSENGSTRGCSCSSYSVTLTPITPHCATKGNPDWQKSPKIGKNYKIPLPVPLKIEEKYPQTRFDTPNLLPTYKICNFFRNFRTHWGIRAGSKDFSPFVEDFGVEAQRAHEKEEFERAACKCQSVNSGDFYRPFFKPPSWKHLNFHHPMSS